MVNQYMTMVIDAAKQDADYQQLLQECRTLGEKYERIWASLSCADREALDRYITICENMEYRKLCLALAFLLKPQQ